VRFPGAGARFAIAWEDWREDAPRARLRLLDGEGQPMGPSQLATPSASRQARPSLGSAARTAAVAWLDDRDGQWDVYASSLSWPCCDSRDSLSPDVEIDLSPCGSPAFSATFHGRAPESIEVCEFPGSVPPGVEDPESWARTYFRIVLHGEGDPVAARLRFAYQEEELAGLAPGTLGLHVLSDGEWRACEAVQDAGSRTLTIEEFPLAPRSTTFWAFRLKSGFRRGFANADEKLDLSDGIYVLEWLFSRGAEPPCRSACDANDDDWVDVSDGVFIFRFLFSGGARPPDPYLDCGRDPTPDSLTCEHASRTP
jgi:hypothetical protein